MCIGLAFTLPVNHNGASFALALLFRLAAWLNG